MQKFKLGDKVVLLPRTYEDIGKSLLLYRERWNASNPKSDIHLMLGGKYTVLEIFEERGETSYELLENSRRQMGNSWERSLIFEEELNHCPYKVGDTVVVDPRNERSRKWLETVYKHGYSFSDHFRKHTVTGILNDYYIFLDYDQDDPWAVPLIWEDFRKV